MTEIKKAIERYIEYCRREQIFTERSLKRYEYILSVYQDFLINKAKLNDASIYPYLKGLTYKEVLASLDYYIDEYSVKAEDTALFYISVIKEFLKYMVQFKIVEDSSIIESFGRSDKDQNGFNYHCIEHLKDLISGEIIKKSSPGTPRSEEEIKKMIAYCDGVLSDLDTANDKMGKDKYNKCVNALITKAVIYTGVSVDKRLFNCPLKFFNQENGCICLNGYPVYLSFNLRKQFITYLNKVYRGNKTNPESLLFARYSGEKINQPGVIGDFIKNALKKLEIRPIGLKPASTICLAKYAIIQLIDLGIDRDTIMDFTGYGDTILSSCKNYADAGKELENKQLLSNRLKSLPLFDTL